MRKFHFWLLSAAITGFSQSASAIPMCGPTPCVDGRVIAQASIAMRGPVPVGPCAAGACGAPVAAPLHMAPIARPVPMSGFAFGFSFARPVGCGGCRRVTCRSCCKTRCASRCGSRCGRGCVKTRFSMTKSGCGGKCTVKGKSVRRF